MSVRRIFGKKKWCNSRARDSDERACKLFKALSVAFKIKLFQSVCYVYSLNMVIHVKNQKC